MVLVVLQNMGDKDILLAPAKGSGGGSSSEGLYVSAELGSAGGPFPFKIVDKDLEPAVGGGGCLKAFASANRKWLFDTRDHQVEKLATGAEAVLGKNADGYRSALRLNANQALFRLRMKINWKSVPEASPPPNASGVAQRYFLPIQLHFRYVDHDGKTISFVSSADPLGYTVTCILVNASEYPNTLPAVGGPVDGVLQ